MSSSAGWIGVAGRMTAVTMECRRAAARLSITRQAGYFPLLKHWLRPHSSGLFCAPTLFFIRRKTVSIASCKIIRYAVFLKEAIVAMANEDKKDFNAMLQQE